jgi:hypothetical protein
MASASLETSFKTTASKVARAEALTRVWLEARQKLCSVAEKASACSEVGKARILMPVWDSSGEPQMTNLAERAAAALNGAKQQVS